VTYSLSVLESDTILLALGGPRHTIATVLIIHELPRLSRERWCPSVVTSSASEPGESDVPVDLVRSTTTILLSRDQESEERLTGSTASELEKTTRCYKYHRGRYRRGRLDRIVPVILPRGASVSVFFPLPRRARRNRL